LPNVEHERGYPIGAIQLADLVGQEVRDTDGLRPGEGCAADHDRTPQRGHDPEETTAFRYPNAHDLKS
jgi:hypothetical protein